jgi:hypothetical protein
MWARAPHKSDTATQQTSTSTSLNVRCDCSTFTATGQRPAWPALTYDSRRNFVTHASVISSVAHMGPVHNGLSSLWPKSGERGGMARCPTLWHRVSTAGRGCESVLSRGRGVRASTESTLPRAVALDSPLSPMALSRGRSSSGTSLRSGTVGVEDGAAHPLHQAGRGGRIGGKAVQQRLTALRAAVRRMRDGVPRVLFTHRSPGPGRQFTPCRDIGRP